MLGALDYDLLPVLVPKHDRVRKVEEALRVLHLLGVSVDEVAKALRGQPKRKRKAKAA
jgi:hypothetical protein